MKLNKLILAALLVASASMSILRAEELDTEKFWRKAVVLFDQAGYGANTEYGKHTRTNLQRVKTKHSNEGTSATKGAGVGASVANALGYGTAKKYPSTTARSEATPKTKIDKHKEAIKKQKNLNKTPAEKKKSAEKKAAKMKFKEKEAAAAKAKAKK